MQRSSTAAPGTEAKVTALSPVGKAPPPRGIFAKIIKVAAAMEPLVKRDHNPDEGWAFVSIDDYYATAAKALLEEGVSWTCVESGFSDQDGLLRWQFDFTVYDVEGNTWQASRVTVPHDFDGPQTAGKVVSYAEKVFLRQLLKLVTGEPDADVSRKPVAKNRRPNPKLAIVNEVPPQEHEPTYDELETAIKLANSVNALNLLIEKNKKMIVRAMKNDPEVHARLAAARTKKLEELEHEQQQVPRQRAAEQGAGQEI